MLCAFRYYSISIQYCFDNKFSRRPYNFHFLMIFFWVKKSSRSLNLSRYKFISTENSRSQIQGSFPALANLYLPGEPCAQFALTEFTVIRWLIDVSPLSETAYLLINIRKSCKLEQRHSRVLLRPVFSRGDLGQIMLSPVSQRSQPIKLKSIMGAGISRVTRLVRKPLETHRRVEKILEKKPKPAPKHPSSEAAIANARKREYSERKCGVICKTFLNLDP